MASNDGHWPFKRIDKQAAEENRGGGDEEMVRY